MNMETDWDTAVIKICNAVSNTQMSSQEEEIAKMKIQYMIFKMCESEEIFNSNLMILDQYAVNGFEENHKCR